MESILTVDDIFIIAGDMKKIDTILDEVINNLMNINISRDQLIKKLEDVLPKVDELLANISKHFTDDPNKFDEETRMLVVTYLATLQDEKSTILHMLTYLKNGR